ncbi:MAG: type II toxin-antitoxin system RelE/ParE family toxin [Deltaproteobacteria bacterium]|nr:type II toxin-antitoxin system RelE/ParE family toxin [Deltaproteobacteria bacterium]
MIAFSHEMANNILHSFIKKSQKTPKKEMKIAGKRLKEVKS